MRASLRKTSLNIKVQKQQSMIVKILKKYKVSLQFDRHLLYHLSCGHKTSGQLTPHMFIGSCSAFTVHMWHIVILWLYDLSWTELSPFCLCCQKTRLMSAGPMGVSPKNLRWGFQPFTLLLHSHQLPNKLPRKINRKWRGCTFT